MSEQSDNLKQIAQIRKAIAPLVAVLSRESDEKITKRLALIETALSTLLQKETVVNIAPPQVDVTVDTAAITKSIEKMQKKAETSDSEFQPHDQAKKGTFSYNGFVKSDGSWYIQRVAKGEQRYAKGTGDYVDSWEKKDNLKYGMLG